MSDKSYTSASAGPGIMLLSAALFGYFGFLTTWKLTGINGQFLVYVAILEWSLKVSAIAFLISAVITFVKPQTGNFIYGVVGLLGAVAFLVVFLFDVADKQHMTVHPVILLMFAAWNGYGSWIGLAGLFRSQSRGTDERTRPE